MKLFEVAALVNSQLSGLQKEALLRLFMASKGGAAMKSIAGNAHLVAATEYLLKTGFVAPAGTDVSVTPEGEGELVKAGLLDDQGPTDQARELLGQPPAKTATKPKPDVDHSVSAGESIPGATT